MKLMLLKDWAKREGITADRARQKIAAGKIETAQKLGRQWFVDELEKNQDNRVKDIYYVIESYKGDESIIYTGSKEKCDEVADNSRFELQRKKGNDIVAVHDFYVQSESERDRIEKRHDDLMEFAKNLSVEELKEVVEIDGKKYAKWILDFDKQKRGN